MYEDCQKKSLKVCVPLIWFEWPERQDWKIVLLFLLIQQLLHQDTVALRFMKLTKIVAVND